MRLSKVWIATLALAAGTLAMASTAIADGWFREMDEAREVSLADVLRDPASFVDVEVKVKLYFHGTGENYNPYYTRFTEEMYGNFVAWPLDTRLYERRDYQRPYGFFFMQRTNKKWDAVKDIDRYDVIEVTATVRHVFQGKPWFEVFEINGASGGMRPDEVKDVVAGDAYFIAGKYKRAMRRYDDAMSSRHTRNVRADLYRKLGDASFYAGEYRAARSAYRRGLDQAPESAVLKAGLAAAEQGITRQREGQAEEVAFLEPAAYTEPVMSDYVSGVDVMIKLLEDPEAVEAEVAMQRLDLEKRAALVRGGTPMELGAGHPVPAPVKENGKTEDKEAAVAPADVATEEPMVEEPEAKPAQAPVEVEVEKPVEEPKADEPKADEPKADEPKADEPKAEEPKAEEPKVEEPKVEEPKHDATETDQPMTDEPAVEAPKNDAPETDEPMVDEPKADEVVDEPKADDVTPVETDMADDAAKALEVAATVVEMPRLPFFGCEEVTDDDLRAVLDEIARNPER